MLHTRFALRRPVTTLMTFIAIALIGVIATWLLPLELFPDIRFPGIQITIPYAGSTPEEVEQLITRPAEEAIATLSGIKEIRSTLVRDRRRARSSSSSGTATRRRSASRCAPSSSRSATSSRRARTAS